MNKLIAELLRDFKFSIVKYSATTHKDLKNSIYYCVKITPYNIFYVFESFNDSDICIEISDSIDNIDVGQFILIGTVKANDKFNCKIISENIKNKDYSEYSFPKSKYYTSPFINNYNNKNNFNANTNKKGDKVMKKKKEKTLNNAVPEEIGNIYYCENNEDRYFYMKITEHNVYDVMINILECFDDKNDSLYLDIKDNGQVSIVERSSNIAKNKVVYSDIIGNNLVIDCNYDSILSIDDLRKNIHIYNDEEFESFCASLKVRSESVEIIFKSNIYTNNVPVKGVVYNLLPDRSYLEKLVLEMDKIRKDDSNILILTNDSIVIKKLISNVVTVEELAISDLINSSYLLLRIGKNLYFIDPKDITVIK